MELDPDTVAEAIRKFDANVTRMDSYRREHNLPPTKSKSVVKALGQSYAETFGHKKTGVQRSPRPGALQFFDPDSVA